MHICNKNIVTVCTYVYTCIDNHNNNNNNNNNYYYYIYIYIYTYLAGRENNPDVFYRFLRLHPRF